MATTEFFSNDTTVTVLFDNETALPSTEVMSTTTESDPANAGDVFRSLFMGVFLTVSLLGNLGLIVSISSSERLRRSMLSLCVVNLSCGFLGQSVFNMPLVLGSSALDRWVDYTASGGNEEDGFMCRYNAFFIEFLDIQALLALALLAGDRLLAVMSPKKYPERFNRKRVSVLILCFWALALIFSFPIIISAVGSQYFPSRYLCGYGQDASFVYVFLMSLFCYIAPVVFILITILVIIRLGMRENQRITTGASSSISIDSALPSRGQTSMAQMLREEIYTAKYAGILLILWCVLNGPYHIMNAISHFRKIDAPVDFPAGLETAFTWIKFSFPCFLPFLTFVYQRETWNELKLLLSVCSKSNSRSNSFESMRTTTGNRIPRTVTPIEIFHNEAIMPPPALETVPEKQSPPPSYVGWQVPVLFATSGGLRLQIGHNQAENDVAPPCPDKPPLGSEASLQVAEENSGSRPPMQSDTGFHSMTRSLSSSGDSHNRTARTTKDLQLDTTDANANGTATTVQLRRSPRIHGNGVTPLNHH